MVIAFIQVMKFIPKGSKSYENPSNLYFIVPGLYRDLLHFPEPKIGRAVPGDTGRATAHPANRTG